jgi:hypothetical protein
MLNLFNMKTKIKIKEKTKQKIAFGLLSFCIKIKTKISRKFVQKNKNSS